MTETLAVRWLSAIPAAERGAALRSIIQRSIDFDWPAQPTILLAERLQELFGREFKMDSALAYNSAEELVEHLAEEILDELFEKSRESGEARLSTAPGPLWDEMLHGHHGNALARSAPFASPDRSEEPR